MINPVIEHLGFPGAMLSGSKRTPPRREGHTIYWNACVFETTERSSKARHKCGTQIWHGDLDVTQDEQALKALATALGHTIYVTPESPWRFDGFEATMRKHDPRRDLPFYRFDP